HRVDPADLVVVEAEVSGGEPTDLDDVAVVVLRGDHRLALEDLECEGHGHGCCSRRSRRSYSSSTDCITLSRYSSRIRMRLECGTFFRASMYSPSGRERSPSMVSSSKLNSLRFWALAAAASAELVADLSCAAARPGKSATISIHTRMRRPTPEVLPTGETRLVSIYIEWQRSHQTPTSWCPTRIDHTRLQFLRALGRCRLSSLLRILQPLLLQLLRILQRLRLLLLDPGLRLGSDELLGLATQREHRRIVRERGLSTRKGHVLLVELDRLFGRVLVPLQDNAPVEVDGRQLRLKLFGRVVLGQRLVRLTEAAVRHPQVDMDLGRSSAIGDRSRQMLLGGGEVLIPQRHLRQRQPCGDEPGASLQRLLVLRGGLVGSTPGQLHVTERQVEIGIGGGDLQRAHAHQLGHRELLTVDVAPEKRLVGPDALRIANERLTRVLLCALVIAGEPVELGQLSAALGVVGEGMRDVVPLGGRRREVPLGTGEPGEPLGSGLERGLLLQRRAVGSVRLVALSLALGEDAQVVVGLGE